MLPRRIVFAGVLFSLAAVCSAADSTASAEQQIRELEADINNAYAANDLPKYFSYYADDFRGLFPEGPTTLPEYIKSWTESVNGGAAIEIFTYTDLQVQVSPGADAAVASYRATVRTKNPGKESSVDNYFETDVFFKRAGKWKLVEVHYSPAQKTKPAAG